MYCFLCDGLSAEVEQEVWGKRRVEKGMKRVISKWEKDTGMERYKKKIIDKRQMLKIRTQRTESHTDSAFYT